MSKPNAQQILDEIAAAFVTFLEAIPKQWLNEYLDFKATYLAIQAYTGVSDARAIELCRDAINHAETNNLDRKQALDDLLERVKSDPLAL